MSRTVQQYLDETPVWGDGTQLAGVPMTNMQWRIWLLASAGKFFEGMVIFMTGVALPLIVMQFGLDATGKGLVGAAPLAGILVGATLLGGLADRYGRKQMFIAEMVLFVLFLAAVAASPSLPWLLVFLFGMGLALGCDYPTAHVVISESIPSRDRGRLVLSAFGFQALGALAGTLAGYLILRVDGSLDDWRWMYASALVPALIVLGGRFFITQSPAWLMWRGRRAEAERSMMHLLHRKPPYPHSVVLRDSSAAKPGAAPSGWRALFSRRHRRATVLASVPWFLQDLSTYGIGIFTPTILAATIGAAAGPPRHVADLVHSQMKAAEGAAAIDLLLLAGIVAAVLLADRVGRIKLQVLGFVGCAAGLGLAAASAFVPAGAALPLIFAGFMLFNFMTNLGPNAMTYLLAGEVYPVHLRGLGAGFAASVGKVGAVITAFLFPLLLHSFGTTALLAGLVAASLLGAWVTWRFRIETKGRNLEELG